MKILADWRFIIGALIAIALAATLIATTLERIFDHREFFAALGETVDFEGLNGRAKNQRRASKVD
jgi:hypothetical protein